MNAPLALFGGTPVREEPFSPYKTLGKEEQDAVNAIMQKGIISDFKAGNVPRFFGGEKVRELEKRFKDYFGTTEAVGFNSATTGLHAALVAAGIGPGDEVITTPLSMGATPASILLAGAVPVFADVDRETYCLDVEAARARLTPKTRAILAVNLFGGSPDYDALRSLAEEHDLVLIEDNAQGIAGTYKNKFLGTIGHVGVFSFNVHKHIQCGEGGMLVTNDSKIAYRAQLVRNHGEAVIAEKVEAGEPFEPIVGSNYRLSELHAAIAVEQFKKLDTLIGHRRDMMARLIAAMKPYNWLTPQTLFQNSKHVYYAFAFRLNCEQAGFSLGAFNAAMKAEGFPLYLGYIKPLYLMPVYQNKQMYMHTRFPFEGAPSYDMGLCPVAEYLCSKELTMLNLAFHYPRTQIDIDSFACALEKIEKNSAALAD